VTMGKEEVQILTFSPALSGLHGKLVPGIRHLRFLDVGFLICKVMVGRCPSGLLALKTL
jgi:hypothetical protein